MERATNLLTVNVGGETLGEVAIVDLALPEGKDVPTTLSESFRMASIARSVSLDFGKPVTEARAGLSGALGAVMPVPEAAMYENHFSPPNECYVGPARKIAPMEAIPTEANFTQFSTHYKFGACVASFDRSHVCASLQWLEPVH